MRYPPPPARRAEDNTANPVNFLLLLLGDAGHWQRAGIAAVVAAGGEVIGRVHWHNLALTDREETPLELWGRRRGLAPTAVGGGGRLVFK